MKVTLLVTQASYCNPTLFDQLQQTATTLTKMIAGATVFDECTIIIIIQGIGIEAAKAYHLELEYYQ